MSYHVNDYHVNDYINGIWSDHYNALVELFCKKYPGIIYDGLEEYLTKQDDLVHNLIMTHSDKPEWVIKEIKYSYSITNPIFKPLIIAHEARIKHLNGFLEKHLSEAKGLSNFDNNMIHKAWPVFIELLEQGEHVFANNKCNHKCVKDFIRIFEEKRVDLQDEYETYIAHLKETEEELMIKLSDIKAKIMMAKMKAIECDNVIDTHLQKLIRV